MKEVKEQWKKENMKNTKVLAVWTGAWLMTMALSVFGPKFIWDQQTGMSLGVILINTIVGIGMIFANKRQIMGLDELQRKITMEAMAVTLGVGVVVGLSYSALDIANVISYDAEISHLVMLIGLTYIGSVFYGKLRYK